MKPAASFRVILVGGEPGDHERFATHVRQMDRRASLEWVRCLDDGPRGLREGRFDVAIVLEPRQGGALADLIAHPDLVAADVPLLLVSDDGVVAPAVAAAIDGALGPEEITAERLARSIRLAIASRERHRALRRFQALIERADELFVVVDAARRPTYVSPTVERLLGVPPEAMQGDILDVVHPDDRARLVEALETLTGDPTIEPRLRHRFAHGDGSWRTVETVAKNLLGDPALRGVVIVSRDVTDLVRAEAASRRHEIELSERVKELRCLYGISEVLLQAGRDWEETLQAVVEGLPGGFQWPERMAARIEVEGRGFVAGGFKGTPWSLSEPIVAGGATVGEVRVEHGAEPPRAAGASFLPEERELLVAVAGRIGERVEHRRASKKLAQSEAYFRTVVDRAGMVVGVLDAEGTIRYASGGLLSVLGVHPEEVVGHDVFSFISTPEQIERARALFARAVADPASLQLGQARIFGDGLGSRHVEYSVRSLIDDPAVGGVVVTIADVTERVERERQIRLQAELLDQVGHTIFAIDREHRVVYWNRAAEKTLGWTFEEVRGEEVLPKIFAPEHVDHVLAIRRLVMEEGVWEGELPLRTKDGRRLILHGGVVTTPLDGVRICAAMDITELRRTQRELMEHRELLANVVSNAPVILYALDDEGRFSLLEGRGLAALGLAPGELVGQSIFDLPYVEPAVADDVRRALAGESFQAVRRLDGRTFETWWSPIAGGQGAIGVSVDVTALRRVEQEHERAAEQIRFQAELLDAVGQAVIATDLEGRVTYWNRAAEALYGYGAEEARGELAIDLTTGAADHGAAADLLTRFATGETWSGELPLRRKDGREFVGLVTNAPLRNARGEISGVVGVSSDLTDHKALEAKLTQAQKLEAIGRLAGGIAHDFNNLLTVIQGHVAMALLAARADPRVTLDLDEIRRAADRAADLTRQLLAFGRKQVLRERVLDLEAELRGMQTLLRRLIPESVAIEMAAKASPTRVRADATQIQQVVLNLAVNASDAMGGRGELSIAVGRRTLTPDDAAALPWHVEPGDYVELAVGDTGSGMPPEVLAHVFEPFFTTKPEGEGTGLGLATVYGIVKQSQGHVFVESELGRGSTFRVLLPSVTAEPTKVQPDEELPRAKAGGETILVVEDDDLVRRVTTRTLRRAGFEVLVAENGRRAIDLVADRLDEVDLLLTDVVMPEMGGPELVQRLRDRDPTLRVVMTSGYPKGDLRDALEAPNVRFIAKPFTVDELVREVRRALDAE